MEICTDKVAWLLPTAWFYWHPSLSEFVKLFPNTKVFTGLFPGFAKGFEDSLDIEIVGERKVIPVIKSKTSYGDNFTYLSPKIIERLLQYKPQIIFSCSFGIWTILALIFKPIGGWKVVIAYDGSSPGVDYKNSTLRIMLRRAMVWAADACVSNSRSGEKYLVENLGASKDRVSVLPYLVPDEKSLTPANKDSIEITSVENRLFSDLTYPRFLFVGSIVPRKGVKCLLEACELLKQSESVQFSVVLVGDGEQRQELEDFCQQHQLNDLVVWAGYVDYADISAYFHHSDIFVFPTLEDTWGLVVLEAMLLGKPVLCSEGAGASELIVQGENGYCFKPDKPQELADVMRKLIENPNLIQSMGRFSKEIMKDYTPKFAALEMKEVIARITNS